MTIKRCMKVINEANEEPPETQAVRRRRKLKEILPDAQREQLQSTIRCEETADPVPTVQQVQRKGRGI